MSRSRVLPPLLSRASRLPIRWRLAVTSAALTFLILAMFAIVVGIFTNRQVRDHFDDDLRATVGDLQTRVRPHQFPNGELKLIGGDALTQAAAGDAVLRVVAADGTTLVPARHNAALGSPLITLHDAGEYRVISRPIFIPQRNGPVAFIQYAKPRESTNGTLDRIRVYLVVGVFGGALLALLAGLAVARRAMGPVQDLTRAAKEIARTRDAAVALPEPIAEDEVADLSRTLSEMLRELSASRAELETILTRQREFVADASHELRTPLTSILANLELLEADLQGEDAEMVQSALRSSRRMRGLVSDLLLLARADAQRERVLEPVDMAHVVRDAAGEAAPLADGHDLVVDVDPGLVVDGLADDLHRMVLNLIENALRHTPLGTEVRASAHAPDPEAVQIVVEDGGPGLPEDIRERAFERFVRGGGDRGRGSGLGLAIVNAVAEGHGGSVAYEDRQNGGARFTIVLPANAAAATPRRPQARSSAAS
ncbi:MAG: two-component system, OmpR family, sensor kinase [Thermoleophilaceae bacterium]|nr:two-component system, OmpR family, sensor kinase [Thermoleophilaceae bacterium]